jgi:CRISPR-associated protein Cpf1
MSVFDESTGVYQVTKTIRQKLIPVGKTLEHIKEKGFVEQDKQRAKDFLAVKGFADAYYRDYIKRCLAGLKVDAALIESHYELYRSVIGTSDEGDESKEVKTKRMQKAFKAYDSSKDKLRKHVAKCFIGLSALLKSAFLVKVLPEWMDEQDCDYKDIQIVHGFNKFTSYFMDYFKLKKSLFSSESKSNALAYRIVDVNLELFFKNKLAFNNVLGLGEQDKRFDGLLDVLHKSDELFELSKAFDYVAQNNINNYNAKFLGVSHEDGSRTKGINSFIYELLAVNKDISRFGVFVKLQRQIFGEGGSLSFVPAFFDTDKEMIAALNAAVEMLESKDGIFNSLSQTILSLSKRDATAIYIKTNKIKFLSNAIFGDYKLIDVVLSENNLNDVSVVSIGQMDELIIKYANTLNSDDGFYSILSELKTQLPVQSGIVGSYIKLKESYDKARELYKTIECLDFLDANRRLPKTRNDEDEGGKGFKQVQIIQSLLECMNAFVVAYRPLHLVENKAAIDMTKALNHDSLFYSGFLDVYSHLDELMFLLYNKVRNHVTKKKSTSKKIKLNFDNYQLLSGWSSGQEQASSSVMFEKDGLYYLGIVNQDNKKLFDYTLKFDEHFNPVKAAKKKAFLNEIKCPDGVGYNKMDYSMVSGFNKMGPKVFISALNRREFFNPSDEIIDITNRSSHTKGGLPKDGFDKAEFNLDDCHKVIDYFKGCLKIHPVWNQFNYNFSKTSTYTNVSEFYVEVEKAAYKVDFTCIKNDYIDAAVESGKLFLFQIYNMDFSPHSKGRDSIHTMYIKNLFSQVNLKAPIIKLNGGGELFWRPALISKEQMIVHKAGIPIKNKNPNAKNKTATYAYDIIKDKKYTKEHFQFNFSITLNHQGAKESFYFNRNFNNEVIRANKKKINVLALKRGEKNLLYYVVMDQSGKIIDHDTLDKVVDPNKIVTDYQVILKDRELKRNASRKAWAAVDGIKELKQGFLGTVLHRVTRLMIEHNAVLCVDGLDAGFKQARQKFEAQIYDRFLIALSNKLNFMVLKEKTIGQAGHVLNAYQLAPKFESLKMLGKQAGAMFIANPSYTTSLCPKSGFVNLIRFQYKNMKNAKSFLGKFEGVRFNKEFNVFDIGFDYEPMFSKRDFTGYKTKWVASTHGDERYFYDKTQKEFECINVNEELQSLLINADIEFKDGEDILPVILEVNSAAFFRDLFFLLNLVFKMRQSNGRGGLDYVLSPIRCSDGSYYNSLDAGNMPCSTDMLGAYLIGVKGLWALQQINETAVDDKVDLFLENEKYFGHFLNMLDNCNPWS